MVHSMAKCKLMWWKSTVFIYQQVLTVDKVQKHGDSMCGALQSQDNFTLIKTTYIHNQTFACFDDLPIWK